MFGNGNLYRTANRIGTEANTIKKTMPRIVIRIKTDIWTRGPTLTQMLELDLSSYYKIYIAVDFDP